jgi:hypothetical protein
MFEGSAQGVCQLHRHVVKSELRRDTAIPAPYFRLGRVIAEPEPELLGQAWHQPVSRNLSR